MWLEIININPLMMMTWCRVSTPQLSISPDDPWPPLPLSSRYLVCITRPQTPHVPPGDQWWWCLDVLSPSSQSSLGNHPIIIPWPLWSHSLKPPQCLPSESGDAWCREGASGWSPLYNTGLWLVAWWRRGSTTDQRQPTTAITQHHGNYLLATTTLYRGCN